jgi:hypothetical protein
MSSVKALFKLMIGCNKQFKSCVSLMKDISRDIHIALGDIEQVVIFITCLSKCAASDNMWHVIVRTICVLFLSVSILMCKCVDC